MPHVLGALHQAKLTFTHKTHEEGDVSSYFFTPDAPVRHIAGQHAVFFLPNRGGYHIFSLSNAPDETEIRITTHVREASEWKQALDALTQGDIVRMRGPVLNFTLEDSPQHAVLLAQGIGITPYRSMLVHEDNVGASRVRTTLIHVDGGPQVFRDETSTLAGEALYPKDPEEFTRDLTRVVAEEPDARYYLSGSGGFLSVTKATLARLGVPRTSIKTDRFLGYH